MLDFIYSLSKNPWIGFWLMEIIKNKLYFKYLFTWSYEEILNFWHKFTLIIRYLSKFYETSKLKITSVFWPNKEWTIYINKFYWLLKSIFSVYDNKSMN